MIDFTTVCVIIVVLYLLTSIKILREYERGVIFRLGRVLPQPKGPGIILVFAPIDRMVRVSLRIDTLEVPSQDVITRDNVTVKVNAVIYFRVIDPRLADPGGFQFPLRHVATGADHAAQRAGRSGSGRTCSASAKSSTCGCNPSWTSTPRLGA